MNQNPRALKGLQIAWYQKLEEHGFEDIENTSKPDRPLKEWHSKRFQTPWCETRKIKNETYYAQIDHFINHSDFNEICVLISKHGNSTVNAMQVQMILELHRAGLTERDIAAKINRGKKCIHLTIKKARAWMRII